MWFRFDLQKMSLGQQGSHWNILCGLRPLLGRYNKKSTNKNTEILSGTQSSREIQTVTNPRVGLYIRTLGTQIRKEIV